ncbi:MAG TPA: helix-turn-helix transcriptional regulator [Thermomicrobiales bacterium]|nr:helix-turn-helix transcriptional regulator [Thermomicrobiales bacterium]
MATSTLLGPNDIAVDHRNMVQRIVGIMRSSDEPMTLDDLAEMAGLSPFYFARTFRSIVGLPPGEFQAALRFERAKHLLLSSPASVTEICFEIGYDSLGTFSSRFKRLVGMSPAQFRELPHIVADTDLEQRIEQNLLRPVGPSSSSVEGTISSPVDVRSHVYVGLFADPIAATRPITGRTLPGPGPFSLRDVPPGTWYLLSAALPAEGSPIDQLLPGPDVLVASGGPIVVRSNRERHIRPLTLRQPIPLDPPLLTALPALLVYHCASCNARL